ncbi:hypothetical protein [Ferrimicrobium acidiphilum]|uniref:hypothetical protein n=1 Tax=Ferrimicrobium acidiphilum TaxID=121039 RepID=UPI0023EF575E|nr:hypothetical protein [Ferrimicrobium acidiphilum]
MNATIVSVGEVVKGQPADHQSSPMAALEQELGRCSVFVASTSGNHEGPFTKQGRPS